MTDPTDDEIDALVAAYLGDCGPQATRVYSFVRAVLAKWGTPAPVGVEPFEPAAYLHDDGYWTPAKNDEGRKLNDRLLRAGSPKIGVYLSTPTAHSALEDAARLERERICAAIKAEDDYCVDHGDYMLDSDDCIKIVRGEWVRPDFSVDAARKQGGAT